MRRFLVMSLFGFMLPGMAFSETYYEKAETAFNNASKMPLTELPEFPEYKRANCVIKRYPNRVNSTSFKIIKSEDVVLGSSARLTLDNTSFTLTEMEDGELGNVDISSSGHVLGRNTLRIVKSANKATFIFQEIEYDGNVLFTTYCWW